jgi:hypothetical protein
VKTRYLHTPTLVSSHLCVLHFPCPEPGHAFQIPRKFNTTTISPFQSLPRPYGLAVRTLLFHVNSPPASFFPRCRRHDRGLRRCREGWISAAQSGLCDEVRHCHYPKPSRREEPSIPTFRVGGKILHIPRGYCIAEYDEWISTKLATYQICQLQFVA